jgi:hypothetical protein
MAGTWCDNTIATVDRLADALGVQLRQEELDPP